MAAGTGAGEYASSEMAKEARLAMMDLANMISVPMALNAVVRLNVPDAVWQSGLNAPLSAAEILALIRPPPPPSSDPEILQRLLRLLASYGVFDETRCAASGARRYALTAVGRTLVPYSSGGDSYAAYVLQHHQDALVRAWPLIHEAVLDPTGPEPFARANSGVPAYAYYGGDREANALMQRAMQGVSEPFMETLLDGYGASAFGGDVQTLVDVGGSSGSCLHMIMQRFPNIKQGINFDLPEVVNAAAPLPGVKHVGGDMFRSIPAGDVIFMKWVLTTWTDEECTSILRNCYEALPEGGGGKVIACEPVLPEETDDSRRTRALLEGDIFVMTIYRTQGRERTEEEFRRLGVAAGFSSCSAVYLDPFYTILEYTNENTDELIEKMSRGKISKRKRALITSQNRGKKHRQARQGEDLRDQTSFICLTLLEASALKAAKDAYVFVGHGMHDKEPQINNCSVFSNWFHFVFFFVSLVSLLIFVTLRD